MGLTGKLWKKTKRVAFVVLSLTTFAGCSGMQATNRTLEEEVLRLKPAGSELKLSHSEVSNELSYEWGLPKGIDLNLTKQEINFDPYLDTGKENPTFTYKISEGKLKFHSKNGRVIGDVIKFWGEDFGHFVPIEELKNDLIDVATGRTNPEDLVLFENSDVTLGEMGQMIWKVNRFSKTTKGEDYLEHEIDLPGSAKIENLTTVVGKFKKKDGSEIEFIHGLKGAYIVNADAYLRFRLGLLNSIPLGDLAKNNLPEGYEGLASLLPSDVSDIKTKKVLINTEAGTYLLDKLTLSQSAQFKKDDWTVGAMQEDSKIRERSSRVYARLDANPEELTVEGGIGKEDFERTTKTNSSSVYGIKNINNRFSVMFGLKNKFTKIETELEREGAEVRVDEEGLHYNNYNEKIRTIKTDSKSEVIYGLAGKKDIYSIPDIATVSLFANITNYPEDETNAGAAINSRILNARLDSNGEGEAYVTILGNKGRNPFIKHFIQMNELGINPLRDEINDIRRRELLRKMYGVYGEVLNEDDELKVGGIIALKGDSYLSLGKIEGQNSEGYYFDTEILGLGLKVSYEKSEDERMHEEIVKARASYYLDNGWSANMEFQGKSDEPTEPERIAFLFRKAF